MTAEPKKLIAVQYVKDAVVKATTDELTVETTMRQLHIAMAAAMVDSSSLSRASVIANAMGKMTKAASEKVVAMKYAGIKATKENLPFFLRNT